VFSGSGTVAVLYWFQGFAKFKGITCATDLSASCPETNSLLDLLDKRLAANRNALCPLGFPAFILSLYGTVYPIEMGLLQLFVGFKPD
jgi:hypothetical protein